jgi:large subunit ribosomal protein L3
VTIGILGNKIGMTQIFDDKGDVIPVTIIKTSPCVITQIKSTETNGYSAIQIGYSEVSPNLKSLTKPRLGHFNKVNLPPFHYLKEYRTDNFSEYEIGQKIGLEMFKIGQNVDITGFTIGKGFASNFKRNNFTTGLMTHGSKSHRLQGSIGAGTTPGRVFPGKKMAGRLGNKKCTIKSLQIIDIDTTENLLIIKGSIPGKSGNLVSIK